MVRSSILTFDIIILGNWYNPEASPSSKFHLPTISPIYLRNPFHTTITINSYQLTIFIRPFSIHGGVLKMTGDGNLIIIFYLILSYHSHFTLHFYLHSSVTILIISGLLYICSTYVPTLSRLYPPD